MRTILFLVSLITAKSLRHVPPPQPLPLTFLTLHLWNALKTAPLKSVPQPMAAIWRVRLRRRQRV